MRCIKCVRHVFNIESFYRLFKAGIPRILYLIISTANGIKRVSVLLTKNDIMIVGSFRTQIEAPNSSLDGRKLSSGGLKLYRLTNQVEGVIALA